MLTAIFDSGIVNNDSKTNLWIKDLTGRDKTLFKLLRTKYKGSIYEELKTIRELPEITYKQTDIQPVLGTLDIRNMNSIQEQFLHSMFKFARHVPNNSDYIHDSVFITEDQFFLKRFLPEIGKQFGLRTYFPNLILVDLQNASGVFHYYEKLHNRYYVNGNRVNIGSTWYDTTLLSMLPQLSQAFNEHTGDQRMSQLIRSLFFKFKKFIYAINCIGIEYYFGTLKEKPIDSKGALNGHVKLTEGFVDYDKLVGFVDPDTTLMFFYHTEYIISLITAICDNLALSAHHLYELNFDPNRISLSKGSGDEFLKEIKAKNVNLKNHIDKFRSFINLIYKFREKVIHQEGLGQYIIGPVPNYNNFIKIDKDIHYFIKDCKDSPSKYKRISTWGVIEHGGQLLLDPFFFTSKVFVNAVALTEGYMPLLKTKQLKP